MKSLYGFLVGFVLLVTTACGAAPAQTGVAQTAVQAAATATATPSTGVAALAKVFKAWSGVKTVRVHVTTTGVISAIPEINVDVVMPDRAHVTSSVIEAVLVGKAAYVKNNGKWQKTDVPAGVDVTLTDPQRLIAQYTSANQVQLVGTETLNGTPTQVYQITTTLQANGAQTYTGKLWVGTADSLPRQIQVELVLGQKSTAVFSDYNSAAISVTAPG